jgi:hypothetical protein
MRILRSEELRGLMSMWQFAGAYGQAVPEFLIMLDKKESMRMAADLTGASSDIFLSDDEYEKAWDQFVQSQQQEMEMRMEEAKANTKIWLTGYLSKLGFEQIDIQFDAPVQIQKR